MSRAKPQSPRVKGNPTPTLCLITAQILPKLSAPPFPCLPGSLCSLRPRDQHPPPPCQALDKPLSREDVASAWSGPTVHGGQPGSLQSMSWVRESKDSQTTHSGPGEGGSRKYNGRCSGNWERLEAKHGARLSLDIPVSPPHCADCAGGTFVF